MANNSATLGENQGHRESRRNAQWELLPLDQVAKILSCSLNTVRNLIHRNELPAVRVGARMVRVRRVDLDVVLRPYEGGQAGMWRHLR